MLWLALALWVYKDARRRMQDPILIGVAVAAGVSASTRVSCSQMPEASSRLLFICGLGGADGERALLLEGLLASSLGLRLLSSGSPGVLLKGSMLVEGVLEALARALSLVLTSEALDTVIFDVEGADALRSLRLHALAEPSSPAGALYFLPADCA